MKKTLLACALMSGLGGWSLQAYTVRNKLAVKKVTITELTYFYGSSSITDDVNKILDPNESFTETRSCTATSASFKAKVGKQNYNVNGLVCNSIVTFDNVDGEVVFIIDQN